MARSVALVILTALSFGSSCVKSQSNKLPEPATIGDVFLLDSAFQKLIPLPKESWKATGRPGWTTATGYIQITGETSALRIKAGEKTEFIFNVGNPEAVRLWQLTRKRTLREVELVEIKHGFHPQRKLLESTPVDITKFGESSYKLVPKSALTSGEYVIDVSGNLYTFGIDP